MKEIITFLFLSLIANSAFAGRFWTGHMDDWHLQLNNGVAYVSSTSFPEQCTYNRAQINFSNDEYVKALWSYILAASKTKEKLSVVLDHDQGAPANSITCVILSADEKT